MRRRTFLASASALIGGCLTAGRNAPTAVSVNDNLIKAILYQTDTTQTLSYYDTDTDSIREYAPKRDTWATATLFIENDDGNPITIDTVDNLTCNDRQPTTSLPFPPQATREDSFIHPQAEQQRRGKTIPAGESKTLNFLFDVSTGPRTYTWTYDGTEYPLSPRRTD